MQYAVRHGTQPSRIIVVVVDFQDVKCPPETIERTKDLWFSTGKISTGSVTEYYSEVSNNAVSLTGEVIGPFTLKETMAYYANERESRCSRVSCAYTNSK